MLLEFRLMIIMNDGNACDAFKTTMYICCFRSHVLVTTYLFQVKLFSSRVDPIRNTSLEIGERKLVCLGIEKSYIIRGDKFTGVPFKVWCGLLLICGFDPKQYAKSGVCKSMISIIQIKIARQVNNFEA